MDKKFFLALLNCSFGLGLFINALIEMLDNNGNIVLPARPIAENMPAASVLLLFSIIGLLIVNAIAYASWED